MPGLSYFGSGPAIRPDVTLYVAVDGDDANPGTFARPFATTSGARAYIRANAINVGMHADVLVLIGPGDYWQTAASFTDADSSSSAMYRVRYRARDGVNTVRLLGGKRLSGWTLWSGSIYRIAVTGANPWTMYENGVRGDLARTPKVIPNASFPEAQRPTYTAPTNAMATGSYTLIPYDSADVNPATWTAGDTQIDLREGGKEWWNTIANISSFDAVNKLFTLDHQIKYGYALVLPNAKYFVKGDRSMLTQAGEWYFDRNDAHGAPGGGGHYLYYWPRATPIESQEIVVPTTSDVLSVVGADPSHPVTGVWFENITIQYSDFTSFWRYGASQGDATSGAGHAPDTSWYAWDGAMYPALRHGAAYFENTQSCGLLGCRIADTGLSGVFAYYFNRGLTVRDCLIEHVGANGVYLEGGWPGEGDIAGGNVVRNCRIRHIGELVLQAAGVWLTNTSNNLLTRLEVSDGRRSGVYLGVSFTVPQAKCYTRGNLVSYVYIHDVCQDSGDVGGLGMEGLGSLTGGPYNTNVFEQIKIDNIFAHPDMLDAGPRGVFTDEQTYGQTFRNLAITNVQNGEFVTHDSGEHVTTNVQGLTAYDSSLVDFKNIGLEPWFPYS